MCPETTKYQYSFENPLNVTGTGLGEPMLVFSLKVSNPEVFCRKGALKISINSQENTFAGVIFWMQLQVLGLQLH